MQTRSPAEILNYFEQRSNQILSFIRNLVEIETGTGDVDGSRQIVALLEQTARRLKAVDAIEKIAIENLGEHLILRAFSDSIEKSVLLVEINGTTNATVEPIPLKTAEFVNFKICR